MGERANLSGPEAQRLLELLVAFIKKQNGRAVKFEALNGQRRSITAQLGYDNGRLNESEWTNAWELLATQPGIITTHGCGRRAVYRYSEQVRVRHTKMSMLSKLTEEQRAQAVAALIELVYEKGCVEKGLARKTIAELFNASDIEFHAWGPIVKSAAGRKQERRIAQQGINFVPASVTEAPVTKASPPKGQPKPGQVTITGVQTMWNGNEPLQFEGNLEIEAEGPFGQMKLKVTKLIVHLLTQVGIL